MCSLWNRSFLCPLSPYQPPCWVHPPIGPQITRARGKRGRKLKARMQCVCLPKNNLSAFLLLQQTVPGLHSRKGTRGALKPALLTLSPSLLSLPVSAAVISFLTPLLTLLLLFLSFSLISLTKKEPHRLRVNDTWTAPSND